MRINEFLSELQKNLSKLPKEEIDAAVDFYEEYFNEALDYCDSEAERDKMEEMLIKEAGTPQQVASRIKAEYAAKYLDNDDNGGEENGGPKNKLSAIWWIVIGICSAPVSIPVAVVTVCCIIGIFAILIAVTISIYAAIIGIGIGGLAAAAVAIVAIGGSAATAALFTGFALMGIAFAAVTGYGAVVGTRALIRAIGRSFSKYDEKRRMKKENRGRL